MLCRSESRRSFRKRRVPTFLSAIWNCSQQATGTRSANIAVRTLPYTSIFRVHENGVYTTYVGNPFNDMLINLDDPTDIRSWTIESMHTLEGGEEAFYERKNIYESKSD